MCRKQICNYVARLILRCLFKVKIGNTYWLDPNGKVGAIGYDIVGECRLDKYVFIRTYRGWAGTGHTRDYITMKKIIDFNNWKRGK